MSPTKTCAISISEVSNPGISEFLTNIPKDSLEWCSRKIVHVLKKGKADFTEKTIAVGESLNLNKNKWGFIAKGQGRG